jgi:hypothetical protein
MSQKRNTRAFSQSSLNSPVASPSSAHRSDKESITNCSAGCNKPVTSGQKALQCNFCKQWCHVDCDGRITTKLYVEYNRNPNEALLFCCKNCKTLNKPNTMSEQHNNILEIKATVERIEGQLIKQDEIVNGIDNKIQNFQAKSYAEVVKATNEINTVVKRVENSVGKQEVEARKLSAIVFGFDEIEEQGPESSIKQLLDKLSLNVPVCSSYRLGKKQRSDRPRPIKVGFQSEKDKWEFLKRLNSIKPDNVFGKLDLTQQEREQEKILVDKLKTIRQERPDAQFKIENWAVVEVMKQGPLKKIFVLSTTTLDP